MRKMVGLVLAAFMTVAVVQGAEAATLIGSFSIAGPFQWVSGAGADTALTLAVAVDFQTAGAGGVNTPGVEGDFSVVSTSGSFTSLAGLNGKIKDFTYDGPANPGFPVPPILSFEIVDAVTVDLLSITSVQRIFGSINTLVIKGTAAFHKPGSEDSFGSFSFSGDGSADAVFAFSATQVAVPEPTTLLLLGLGLAGVGIGGRLRRRR